MANRSDRRPRADVITLCEMKHATDPFRIGKAYALELERKLTVFAERTATRKDVQPALVTSHGFVPDAWSEDLVDATVGLDASFVSVD